MSNISVEKLLSSFHVDIPRRRIIEESFLLQNRYADQTFTLSIIPDQAISSLSARSAFTFGMVYLDRHLIGFLPEFFLKFMNYTSSRNDRKNSVPTLFLCSRWAL